MSKSSLLSVYDIDNQQFILDGVERTEVIEKFGIDSHKISQYITMGYKLNGQYIICRQEDAGKVKKAYALPKVRIASNDNDDFLARWNDSMDAIRLLQNGGHIVYRNGKPHHVEAIR